MHLSNVFGIRRHKRYLVDFDASIHEQAHRLNLKGRVKDISEDGLMLHCRDSINPGSLLDLHFQLPSRSDDETPRIHVTAKVMRCMLRPDGSFFEVAVHFREFHEQQEASFKHYLERLSN